jgi:hypothetical protein
MIGLHAWPSAFELDLCRFGLIAFLDAADQAV